VETPVIPEEEWRRRENTLAALRQAGFRISGKGGAGSFLAFTQGTLTSRSKALGIDKTKIAEKSSVFAG
jgi:hypothetical protein